MRFSKSLVICALLVGTGACKQKSQPPTALAPPAAGGATTTSKPTGDPRMAAQSAAMFRDEPKLKVPTVTLVEAGAEPRTKMRYAFKADRSESLALDMRTGATRQLDGHTVEDVNLPTIHVVLLVEPKGVSRDGALTYTATVESAMVVPDPKGDPTLLAGVKEQVDLLKGIRAHATVDARGIATDAALDSLVGMSGDNQMADQIVQTLRDLSPPFPEEAVGIGAKWEKVTLLDEKGASVTQRESYTLTDHSGDRGKVKIGIAQSAPAQAVAGQGVPEGTKIESLVTEASGMSSFDLGHVVPNSNLDGLTTISLAANDGAEAHTMKMVMRLGVAIAGGKR